MRAESDNDFGQNDESGNVVHSITSTDSSSVNIVYSSVNVVNSAAFAVSAVHTSPSFSVVYNSVDDSLACEENIVKNESNNKLDTIVKDGEEGKSNQLITAKKSKAVRKRKKKRGRPPKSDTISVLGVTIQSDLSSKSIASPLKKQVKSNETETSALENNTNENESNQNVDSREEKKRTKRVRNIIVSGVDSVPLTTSLSTKSTVSPASKKKKDVDKSSDQTVCNVNNFNCLKVDRDTPNVSDLYLNGDSMMTYFSLKIIPEHYKRNNNEHRMIVVHPSVWGRSLNIELTHWGTSRTSPITSLWTIPKDVVTWEYVMIPVNIAAKNHWFLAVGNRHSLITIYDTLGGRHRGIHERLRNIMNVVGGGDCEIRYARCGVDFQRQEKSFECGYECCILGEKLLGGEKLFHNMDYIWNWRDRACNLLLPYVDTDFVSFEQLIQIGIDSVQVESSSIASKQIVHRRIIDDRPSTSRAATARAQIVERDEEALFDDGSFLLSISAEEKLCLSIDYYHCERMNNNNPLWFTDTVISVIFILKILAEHSKRSNGDKIVFVNPVVWRDMQPSKKKVKIDGKYKIVPGEVYSAKPPNCWHTNGDMSKRGIITFPNHLNNWDRAIIPVNVDNDHWTLAIAIRAESHIYYYDTLGYQPRISIENDLKLITSLLGCENLTIKYPVCGEDFVRQTDNIGAWTCGAHTCILGAKIVSGNDDLFYDLDFILEFRRNMNDLLLNALHVLNIKDETLISAKQLFDTGILLLNLTDNVLTSIAPVQGMTRRGIDDENDQNGSVVITQENTRTSVADDDDTTKSVAADNDDDDNNKDNNDQATNNQDELHDTFTTPTTGNRKRDKVKRKKEEARIRMQQKRASLSVEKKEIILQKQKEDNVLSRTSETPKQTKHRQEKVRKEMAASRTKRKLFESPTFKSAFLLPGDPLPEPWNPGPFRLKENQCQSCYAYYFKGERKKCCADGQVRLPTFDINYPPTIKSLFVDKLNINHEHFRKYVRLYNGLLAPISRNVEVINKPEIGKKQEGGLMYKIKGTIEYLISSLKPAINKPHLFLQLYLFNAADAASIQLSNMKPDLRKIIRPPLLLFLHKILRIYFPLARDMKSTYERIEEQEKEAAKNENREIRDIEITIVRKEGTNKKTHNLPTSKTEIAALYIPPEKMRGDTRPMFTVSNRTDGKLHSFPFNSPLCDPFVFPLIHMNGQLGWNENMKLFPKQNKKSVTTNKLATIDDDTAKDDNNINNNDNNDDDTVGDANADVVSSDKYSRKGKHRQRVTMAQFVRFHCYERPQWTPIVGGGAEFLQWVTESAHKIQHNRLVLYREPEMQKKFRIETFRGLQDYVNKKCAEQGVAAGKMILMPPNYRGSHRDMANTFQNAMCMVQQLGLPTYFITITMNADHIKQYIHDYETKEERVDLSDRYFELMLENLLDEIENKKILGTSIGRVYVKEFQKRGGKHAHIVVIMHKDDQPKTAEEIDKVICAEIPDKDTDPIMHTLVVKQMIHGPCGERNRFCVCMEDNGKGRKVCIRKFPKKPCGETVVTKKGYVEYRRRCLKSYTFGRQQQYQITDADCVPYNRYFLRKWGCHCNVELVEFEGVVKYLFKYITKGEAWATVELYLSAQKGIYDEMRSYELCRYLSANEAVHEVFEDMLYSMTHKVTKLDIHLPNQEMIPFEEGNEQSQINYNRMTHLKAFFALNDPNDTQHYHVDAANYFYLEIPRYYTWTNEGWKPRKNKGHGEKNLSRLPFHSYIDKQTYALRILLLNVKGASSFESLRTYNNEIFASFHEAALARGLITDTKQIILYIREATNTMSGKQLRLMFAILICNIIDFSAETIGNLWTEFRNLFCDDFEYKLQSIKMSDEDRWERAYGYGLMDMEKLIIQCNGTKNNKKVGLPKPPNFPPIDHIDESLDKERHRQTYLDMYELIKLNSDQKRFVDTISNTVDSLLPPTQRLFFLYASGGTGKTFVLNCLIHKYRAIHRDHVIAVAFTGIAALLLDGGQTAHSQFKINKREVCNINATSKLADRIRRCKLLVIDEISMMSNKIMEKLDRSLKDIAPKKDKHLVFGGKIVVLSGDIRQNLPVVKNGGKHEILNECITQWKHWNEFKIYSLTKNMRLNANETAYQEWLLKVGEGKIERALNCSEYEIKIDPDRIVPAHTLIDTIFNDDYMEALEKRDFEAIANSIILTARNDEAAEINKQVFAKTKGEGRVYTSIDTTVTMKNPLDDMVSSGIPTELLNNYTPDGFPPHELHLKENCVVIVIRNLNIDAGLVNGTRLLVIKLYPNSIECIILNGNRMGENVCLFPIDFVLDEDEHPIKMRRHQLPVKLSFAITIHKAQGQTFSGRVGLWLLTPPFCHGQFYVACSRVKDPNLFYIVLYTSTDPDRLNVVRNPVYREVFQYF